jgi:hypothetical protein
MVAEAKAKAYDGYNIDWEMDQWATTDAQYGAKLVSFLKAFKSALNAEGMALTFDVVDFNVLQSNCSGGGGPMDLARLGDAVDLAIIEAYGSQLGTKTANCPASLQDPLLCYQTFMDYLNLMCVYMPMDKISIGLNACSPNDPSCGGGSNTIAAEAMTAIEAYGIKSVAIFPQINSAGPGGDYAIYDSADIPGGETWFSLFSKFLGH